MLIESSFSTAFSLVPAEVLLSLTVVVTSGLMSLGKSSFFGGAVFKRKQQLSFLAFSYFCYDVGLESKEERK